MEPVEAKKALKYALSSEMLKLYGTLLLADISLIGGAWLVKKWSVRGGTAGFIGHLLGGILLVAGFIIGITAFVAFLYKLFTDANRSTK